MNLRLTGAQIDALRVAGQGMCRVCGAVLSGDIGPDDENLECEACGNCEVYGADALLELDDVIVDGMTLDARQIALEEGESSP